MELLIFANTRNREAAVLALDYNTSIHKLLEKGLGSVAILLLLFQVIKSPLQIVKIRQLLLELLLLVQLQLLLLLDLGFRAAPLGAGLEEVRRYSLVGCRINMVREEQMNPTTYCSPPWTRGISLRYQDPFGS